MLNRSQSFFTSLKWILSLLFVSSLLSVPALAKSKKSRKRLRYKKAKVVSDSKVAEGFSISLVKDFTRGRAKAISPTPDLIVDSGESNTDQIIGLGLGYTNINVRSFGWEARGVFHTFDNSDSDVDRYLTKAEFNGNYGFTRRFFAYAGVNLNYLHFVDNSEDNDIEIDSDIGWGGQLGFGAQFTKNIGARLGYGHQVSRDKVFVNGDFLGELEITLRGFELSLVGTF